MKYLDIPKYKIRPVPNRFLIDKVLLLLGLGILLYIGVYVNYYLLNKTVPLFASLAIIIGIALLCILELLLSYVKYGNYSYEFHEHKIVINDNKTQVIEYSDVHNMHYSMNLIDKYMRTGTIVLDMKNGKTVKLRHLDNPNQAYFMMQKSVGR